MERGRHLRLTSPSFARWRRLLNYIYDVMGALHDCRAAKFDSCNNLSPSVHAVLVIIMRSVSLNIKREKYYFGWKCAAVRGHPFMTSTKNQVLTPSPLSTWAGPPIPPLWTSTRGRNEIHTALLKWLVQ